MGMTPWRTTASSCPSDTSGDRRCIGRRSNSERANVTVPVVPAVGCAIDIVTPQMGPRTVICCALYVGAAAVRIPRGFETRRTSNANPMNINQKTIKRAAVLFEE